MPVFVACFAGYDSFFFWLFVCGFVAWVGSRVSLYLYSEKPNVKACIGGLLAAIPLLDGLMLASVQAIIPSLGCVLVFLIIPHLHKRISGT